MHIYYLLGGSNKKNVGLIKKTNVWMMKSVSWPFVEVKTEETKRKYRLMYLCSLLTHIIFMAIRDAMKGRFIQKYTLKCVVRRDIKAA